jgi:hypothetical protein
VRVQVPPRALSNKEIGMDIELSGGVKDGLYIQTDQEDIEVIALINLEAGSLDPNQIKVIDLADPSMYTYYHRTIERNARGFIIFEYQENHRP